VRQLQLRKPALAVAAGAPPLFASSNRPNTLPLSNRRKQAQSIEPLALTSAVLWQSPMSA